MAADSSTAVAVDGGGGFDLESVVASGVSAFDDVSTETPEVPSTETPETPDPAAEAPVGDRGDGRDAQGRFAPKGKAEESSEEVPPSAEAPAETVAPPTPGAAEAVTETPRETPAQDAAPVEPFVVRHGNTDFEIPGSVVTKDGIVIPIEQGELVRAFVGKGIKFDETREQLRRDRIELEQTKAESAAEAQAFSSELDNLFAIAAIQDENEFAQRALEYMLDLRQHLPVLHERRSLAKEKAELALQRRMAEPDPEQRAASLQQAFDVTVQRELGKLRSHTDAKVMRDEDWQWIEQKIRSDPGLFLHRVGPKLTEWEQRAGFQPGETVFNDQRFLQVASERHQYRKNLDEAEARGRRATEEAVRTAKANAQRQSSEAPPPPPAVTPAGSAPVRDSNNASDRPRSMDDVKRRLGIAF